jgi:hypothetical protein
MRVTIVTIVTIVISASSAPGVGGIVRITNLENNQDQGTAFTGRRYIAGFDSNTEDEIYDDGEEFFDIVDIPIWLRVAELINLRT